MSAWLVVSTLNELSASRPITAVHQLERAVLGTGTAGILLRSQVSAFIPGLKLSELLYREAVAPILAGAFPGLPHAAGLLGPGSEVLGYDTPQSTDHNWGPRLLLFFDEEDLGRHGSPVAATLGRELPHEIRGYSTNFALPIEEGTVRLEVATTWPVNHGVEVTSVARFLKKQLGIETFDAIDAEDWLTFSEQSLLEITTGEVFHDGFGEVERLRTAFRYYPDDIWFHLLAAQWTRIAELEAFVGRCGDVGDELGSALIASSIVRDLMSLCFLLERRYAPYPKWFGSAFSQLSCGARMSPILESVLSAREWRERESNLTSACAAVATLHNRSAITDPLPTEARRFHERPYCVIDAARFAKAIKTRIRDERVKSLAAGIGSCDQFVDSTAVLTRPDVRRRLRAIYQR
jgi:hypothetical protein